MPSLISPANWVRHVIACALVMLAGLAPAWAADQPVDGMWFGRIDPLPARVKLAFRLDADAWNGVRRVRFLIEAAEL